MKKATLWVLIKDGKIFLWEKKRWFAKWILNGVGWKQEDDETIRDCMIREAKEEIGIQIKDIEELWVLHSNFTDNTSWNQDVHIFMIKDFDWDIIESEEIKPFWFDLKDIPYDKMWKDDSIWLPRVLIWETDIEYNFYFNTDNSELLKYEKIK